ncbi:hypothetical protein L6R53_06520 [Myxococcota bacterium]|nr:hypothetical protein [Myxococcota bacterium]
MPNLDPGLLSRLPPSFWVALTVVSAVVALASMVVVPLLLVRLPVDYVTAAHPPLRRRLAQATPGALALLLLRNLAGGVLLALGLLMLFTPGQGILTLVAGLALVDLPGRHRVLVALLRRPAVARAVQRLRARAQVAPLEGLPPWTPRAG